MKDKQTTIKLDVTLVHDGPAVTGFLNDAPFIITQGKGDCDVRAKLKQVLKSYLSIRNMERKSMGCSNGGQETGKV